MRYVAASLAATVVFAAMVVITPAVRAAPTQFSGFDDFDDYQAGLLPGTEGETAFYTYATGGSTPTACRVSNAESQSAPNSIAIGKTTAGPAVCTGAFSFYESLCGHPEMTIRFNFKMSAISSNTDVMLINDAPPPADTIAGADAAGFRVDATGNMFAVSDSVSGNTIGGLTVTADTWYDITFSSVNCDGTGQFFVSVAGFGASSVTDPTIAAGAAQDGFNEMRAGLGGGGADRIVYIDDLRITGAVTIAETNVVCKQGGGCGNEVTGWTGDLVGFDVNIFGDVVMARTQESSTVGNVRAFNPTSLAQIGAGPYDTECNRPDGVMSYAQYPPGQFYTGFTGCHTAASTVDTFHIRSGSLGDPDFTGTQCAEADFCEFSGNVDLTGTATVDCVFGALPTTPLEIANMVSVPISFREGFNPASSQARRVYVGFAYTNIDAGTVGFWVTKLVNNNDDRSCRTELPFAPPGITVNAFCGIRYLNQTISPTGDFIGGMASGTGGKFWSVRVTNLDDESQSTTPTLQMNAVGPTLPSNIGMGCSGTNDVLTISSTGQVIRWHVFPGEDRTQPTYTNGVPSYPETATPGTSAWTFSSGYSPPGNSIAMDDTGNWGAYISSATKVTVINATTGTAVATVTMPSGTYHSMFLTRNGQNLYIATEDEISRYEIYTATTGTPVCPLCNPDGSQQNSDGTTTITGPGDDDGAGGTGGSLVGALITPFLGELGGTANLILGLIIILIFLGIGFVIIRKRGNPS